jgi:hypothetical protein
MTDLRVWLDERRRAAKLEAIERRGRAAFLEGAEAQSQAAKGRPLTADELERVMKSYPRPSGPGHNVSRGCRGAVAGCRGPAADGRREGLGDQAVPGLRGKRRSIPLLAHAGTCNCVADPTVRRVRLRNKRILARRWTVAAGDSMGSGP